MYYYSLLFIMLVKKNNWMFVDPIFRHINMATGPYSISIFANENNAGLSTEGRPWRSNVRCIHRFNAAKVESGQRIDLGWSHRQASAS